jgi:chitinase
MKLLLFLQLFFISCYCHKGHNDKSINKNTKLNKTTSTINSTNNNVIVTYFTEWSIYDRQFFIKDIPGDKITHLNYAFAKPTIDGNLEIVDRFAFLEKIMTNSTISNTSYVNGNCNELMLLKQKYRHLKTLISIGGWTLSHDFSTIMNNNITRNKFVDSCINFMLNYGFDGLDFDWEYPGGGGLETNIVNEKDGENFAIFLRDLRNKLNTIEDGKWLITLAVSADPKKINNLQPNNIHQYCDFINIMTYDFEGSWSTKTGHLANLYKNKNVTESFSVEEAVNTYLSFNVPSNKLVIGVPFYGRGFANTILPLGNSFSGVGNGTWEAGVYDYKKLPIGKEYIDNITVSAYSYDETQRLLISYDNPDTIKMKINYVKSKNLGGVMSWSIDSDMPTTSNRSLSNIIFSELTKGTTLQMTANKINFKNSTFINIKNDNFTNPYRPKIKILHSQNNQTKKIQKKETKKAK